jgi:hypothetical protein
VPKEHNTIWQHEFEKLWATQKKILKTNMFCGVSVV